MLVRRGAILPLVVAALAAPVGASAGGRELVALAPSAPIPADALPVAPSLGIWSVREGERVPGALARGPNRRVVRLEAYATDPLAPSEWWLNAVGADRAPLPSGVGRTVTVVDTGIDATHPELDAMNVLLLNRQSTPARGEEHHGTAIASIIGAPADGRGMVGVYPGVPVASYDVGGQTLAEVLAGIAEAIQQPGPGILNLSIGFEGIAGADLLELGVDSAVAAGWVVVAAAGNGGERGSPATYPADLPHVVTVAAIDRSDNVATFSNRSASIDLAAPGVGILAAVPTWKDPSGFASLSGTSFAAPIVAGAASWIWTERPWLDWTQVTAILHRSAHDLDPVGVDPASGWGLLDIPAALALPAPIRDPQEPNDDIRLVADGGVFGAGTTPLVQATVPHTSVAARLSPHDDPADVYRVYVPPGREVSARLRSGRDVQLALWGPKTQGIHETATLRRRDLLGEGRIVRTRTSGKGGYYYLAATLLPGGPEEAYLVNVVLNAVPSRPTIPPGAAAASSARGR
jgi:subtilisin family serine protease